MITKQPELRHGLPLTINFEIPAYWIPEQALAVMTPPTPKSTINRSEPLDLKTKGPKRGPPYPKDVWPSPVWFFTAGNNSDCLGLKREPRSGNVSMSRPLKPRRLGKEESDQD
jgi:hypothetical protein